jgi:hypothetical protein
MQSMIHVLLLVLWTVEVTSFVPRCRRPAGREYHVSPVRATLFEDEEEMIPIAEHYIRAKYKAVVASRDHSKCDKDDAREILQDVLPPVTKEELDQEVDNIISSISSNNAQAQGSGDGIDEDDLTKAIVQNSYWQSAGDLVVSSVFFAAILFSKEANKNKKMRSCMLCCLTVGVVPF